MSRRGRPSAEQSRAITDVILNIATDLFLSEGYDGVAMDAVASRAGIPRKTLYKRFPDKGALLEAVLVKRVTSWGGIAEQQNANLTDDIEQRLVRYMTTVILWATSEEVRAFTKLFASAEGLSPQARNRHQFYGQSEMIDVIVADIDTYGPLCGIHPANACQVARMLMALVAGWLDLNGFPPLSEAEATKEAATLVNVLLRGKDAW